MTFAFGHLIFAWILGNVYEISSKKKISHYGWLFLLIGGVLPDIDYLFEWTFFSGIHRTFTHSLFFALIVLGVSLITFKLMDENNSKEYSYLLFVGILIHLIVDFVSVQGIMFFWPAQIYLTPLMGRMINISSYKLAVLDMGLGTIWLFYLLFKRRLVFKVAKHL
jgi:membrane-bound metal-dependent hydrolase YbcI (DUF457 family)